MDAQTKERMERLTEENSKYHQESIRLRRRVASLERQIEGTDFSEHTFALDGGVCDHCGHVDGEEDYGCPNGEMGMLENKVELLKEDIECVHLWLDDVSAPREGSEGTYSIVGRMKQLLVVPKQALIANGSAAPPYPHYVNDSKNSGLYKSGQEKWGIAASAKAGDIHHGPDGVTIAGEDGIFRAEGTESLKFHRTKMTVACDSFEWDGDGERYIAKGVHILREGLSETKETP